MKEQYRPSAKMSDKQTAPSDRIFRLASQPNNFDWGPLGSESLVAKYVPNASKPGYEVKKDEPYSEVSISP